MINIKEMHDEYKKIAEELDNVRYKGSEKISEHIIKNIDSDETLEKINKHEILITAHFHYNELVISLHPLTPKPVCEEWEASFDKTKYFITSSFVDIEDVRAIDAALTKG